LRLDITQKHLDSLNRVYQQYLNNRNIVNIKNLLEMTYQRFIDEQRDFNISFIKQYPTSFVSLMALYQQIDSKTYILYKDEDLQYFAKVDSSLYKQYPKAPYVLSLHANVAQMREQHNKLKMQRMLSDMGAKAQEIALPSPKGDTIRLSSFKGKYVLVDFWASWCSPCRQENPNLVKIYKKYKAKGFEIFQVSLDKTKEAWTKAIKDDGLTWIQVSDLKYWDSQTAKTYNIESIPSSFLLDKDGSIMAKNLRGESLQEKLVSLLGE
jgi:peroxiredoxin